MSKVSQSKHVMNMNLYFIATFYAAGKHTFDSFGKDAFVGKYFNTSSVKKNIFIC